GQRPAGRDVQSVVNESLAPHAYQNEGRIERHRRDGRHGDTAIAPNRITRCDQTDPARQAGHGVAERRGFARRQLVQGSTEQLAVRWKRPRSHDSLQHRQRWRRFRPARFQLAAIDASSDSRVFATAVSSAPRSTGSSAAAVGTTFGVTGTRCPTASLTNVHSRSPPAAPTSPASTTNAGSTTVHTDATPTANRWASSCKKASAGD